MNSMCWVVSVSLPKKYILFSGKLLNWRNCSTQRGLVTGKIHIVKTNEKNQNHVLHSIVCKVDKCWISNACGTCATSWSYHAVPNFPHSQKMLVQFISVWILFDSILSLFALFSLFRYTMCSNYSKLQLGTCKRIAFGYFYLILSLWQKIHLATGKIYFAKCTVAHWQHSAYLILLSWGFLLW